MVLWRVVLEAFPSPARICFRTVLQIGSPDKAGEGAFTWYSIVLMRSDRYYV